MLLLGLKEVAQGLEGRGLRAVAEREVWNQVRAPALPSTRLADTHV